MKIGRIKEIRNIGTFAKFVNGASLGFEKLTFIYGFNTYGKTTLADILQSLKNNDPQRIQSRKTIPQQSTSQKVVLTVKDQTESDVTFINNSWSNSNTNAHLEVFGTEFIHKNLFTGLTIERENRENFTQFVLGEHGVKIAEEIAEKRKDSGDKKRDLKPPPFVKNKSDEEVKKFLDFSIQNLSIEELENNLSRKRISLQNEKDRLKEPQKILELLEPVGYDVSEPTLIKDLANFNGFLQEDFSDIKEEVLLKLKKHLDTNFSSQDSAENWIKAGIHYSKGKEHGNCPFCGQAIENAQNLIDVYHSYFNLEYSKFIDKIAHGLDDNLQKVEEFYFTQKVRIQDSLTKATRFKELISDSDFQNKLSELENTIELLHEDVLNTKKSQLLIEMRSKRDLKNKSPYKKIDIINNQDFKTSLDSYSKILVRNEELIDILCKKIKDFKESYKDTSVIQEKINLVEVEVEELEYKKARIEQEEYCNEYYSIQESINLLEKNILDLQKKLREDQSYYLDNYFTEINKLFERLGSRNFALEKITDNSGHLPVYSLKVKFHGIDIPNNQLKVVFSESDRRALALVLFWAKISLMTNEEKAQMIIVLDDPVTSFDDNRLTSSINLFKDYLSQVSQMVILTHYPHFIKRFCEITKEVQITTKFLKIEQNDATSFLVDSARIDFIMSDYERVFMKIYGFINRKHLESIKADLRPFLENLYLPTVFAKQIQDKKVDCGDLESMINGIFGDDDIKRKLHEFRTTLNPDSHLFTSNNDEDVRNLAREMMDYLYSLNFPRG